MNDEHDPIEVPWPVGSEPTLAGQLRAAGVRHWDDRPLFDYAANEVERLTEKAGAKDREIGKLSYRLHRRELELEVAVSMLIERTPFSPEAIRMMIQVKTDEL